MAAHSKKLAARAARYLGPGNSNKYPMTTRTLPYTDRGGRKPPLTENRHQYADERITIAPIAKDYDEFGGEAWRRGVRRRA